MPNSTATTQSIVTKRTAQEPQSLLMAKHMLYHDMIRRSITTFDLIARSRFMHELFSRNMQTSFYIFGGG